MLLGIETMTISIPDAIVEHARKSPEAAQPFSIAAELLRRAGG